MRRTSDRKRLAIEDSMDVVSVAKAVISQDEFAVLQGGWREWASQEGVTTELRRNI